MSLPKALVRHRTLNLMTQEEYAVYLGVSQSSLQLWESGRVPSAAFAKKLIAKGVDKAAVMQAVTERAMRRAA